MIYEWDEAKRKANLEGGANQSDARVPQNPSPALPLSGKGAKKPP